VNNSLVRKYVNSSYIDVLGAGLIFFTCVWRDFLGTIYYEGTIQFGTALSELPEMMVNGAYPLGVFSTVGAVFSLLSTRLVGKQNNWGNLIGIITTVNSGTNDFLFGNRSAIITYPITFIVHTFATYNWAKGEKIRKVDSRYFVIIGISMIIAYSLVYLGFSWFGGLDSTLFFHTVAITFGLSLGANAASSLKYEETWLSWTIYNLVQLIKNSIQLNVANIAKYIFYLFNAVITLLDWKWNGDQKERIIAEG
jgi:nicotinamide mononucleotide transporter